MKFKGTKEKKSWKNFGDIDDAERYKFLQTFICLI